MKRYKLLKDLPTFKAGGLFYISEYGALVYDDGGFGVMAYAQSTLEKFPNILTEWFEEIKEPVNSIHWKPNFGEEYWCVNYIGNVVCRSWEDASVDLWLLESGNVYRTMEEAQKARERRLAEVRLRQTSDFKPDFEDANGGWTVYYSYKDKKMNSFFAGYDDAGEIVCYETKEDAEKSIEENREDWLKYFGIEED